MTMNNPYEQYQQNSIFTANPEDLTLMLYNGIVKFLNLAKVQIEEKNIQEAHNNIIKAQNIVLELRDTLDMQYEISNNLYSLYDFMYNHLIQANCNKFEIGIQYIDEVSNLTRDLRDTWQEAMKIAKTQKRKSG